MLIPKVNTGMGFFLRSLAVAREKKETDRHGIGSCPCSRSSGQVAFPWPYFSTHEGSPVPLVNQLLGEGHVGSLTDIPKMLQMTQTIPVPGSPTQRNFQIVLYPLYPKWETKDLQILEGLVMILMLWQASPVTNTEELNSWLDMKKIFSFFKSATCEILSFVSLLMKFM